MENEVEVEVLPPEAANIARLSVFTPTEIEQLTNVGIAIGDRSAMIPEDLSEDLWRRSCAGLKNRTEGLLERIQFVVGDWLLFGEKHFSQTHSQVAELTGFDETYVQQIVFTCDKVRQKEREDFPLPWSHFRVLTQHGEMGVMEQRRLLKAAIEEAPAGKTWESKQAFEDRVRVASAEKKATKGKAEGDEPVEVIVYRAFHFSFRQFKARGHEKETKAEYLDEMRADFEEHARIHTEPAYARQVEARQERERVKAEEERETKRKEREQARKDREKEQRRKLGVQVTRLREAGMEGEMLTALAELAPALEAGFKPSEVPTQHLKAATKLLVPIAAEPEPQAEKPARKAKAKGKSKSKKAAK